MAGQARQGAERCERGEGRDGRMEEGERSKEEEKKHVFKNPNSEPLFKGIKNTVAV